MAKDISQAVPDAEKFDAVVVTGLRRAVGHTIVTTVAKARSEHRWQDRTYATRGSIDGEVDDGAKGASGNVRAGRIAVYMNDGTRPHAIVATHAKALRFVQGGVARFARSVWHPGTKPDFFLEAAQNFADEELQAAVDAVIAEALG
jgi:hypothetical protein